MVPARSITLALVFLAGTISEPAQARGAGQGPPAATQKAEEKSQAPRAAPPTLARDDQECLGAFACPHEG